VRASEARRERRERTLALEPTTLETDRKRDPVRRRAQIAFDVVEQGDSITLHADRDRWPPLWFNKRERPVAYAKLKHMLDDLEVVEELPPKLAS
jgi:hypothetical protein